MNVFQKYRPLLEFLEKKHIKINPNNFCNRLYDNYEKVFSVFFKNFIRYARDSRFDRDESYYIVIRVGLVMYDAIKNKVFYQKNRSENGLFLHWYYDDGWTYDEGDLSRYDLNLVTGDIVLAYDIEVYLDDENYYLDMQYNYVLDAPYFVKNLDLKPTESFLKSIEKNLDKILH